MMRVLPLLALAACLTAGAENAESVPTPADPHEHAAADVRGTLASIEGVRAQVMAMSAEQRAEAKEAAHALMVSCPYNRASFQLPFAMEHIASRYEADDQHGLIRDDWRRLRQGLAAHVEVLDALGGGELPAPQSGDYLVTLAPELVVDRAHLDRAEDPIGETMELMLRIQDLVDGYDPATKARIDGTSATLSAATGDQWTLKLQLIGWKTALERMEPFIEDEAMAADVRQMIVGVAYYLGPFC